MAGADAADGAAGRARDPFRLLLRSSRRPRLRLRLRPRRREERRRDVERERERERRLRPLLRYGWCWLRRPRCLERERERSEELRDTLREAPRDELRDCRTAHDGE